MRTLMTCALSNTDFYSLSDKLYIEDIEEAAAITTETANRPYYGLYLLTPSEHSTLTITVTFMVKERDRIQRAAIIQQVSGWATKGYFTCNTHPGQRIFVICTEPPKIKTFDHTDRMTIVFTAYGEACWEEATPYAVSFSSKKNASSSAFRPNGTRTCFLEAEITNAASAALTSVVLTANGKSITLSGLSVAAGGTVTLTYDELHHMRIMNGNTSILDKRTGEDDLLLNPGVNNTVSCVTNVACNTTLKARGLWR